MTRIRLAALVAVAVAATAIIADTPKADKPKEQPQFLLTIYEPESEFASRTGEKSKAYWDKYMAYAKELADAGVTVSGNAVLPPETGKTVVGKDGKATTADGSFVSNAAKPGGYFVIKAKDLDEATMWAAKCPCVAAGGAVDVRPVLVMPMPAK